MSIKTTENLIGKAGLIKLGAMQFTVFVRDVKNSYGNLRLLVQPANGTGQEWKDADKITLLESGFAAPNNGMQ